jgi:hypothetical protein
VAGRKVIGWSVARSAHYLAGKTHSPIAGLPSAQSRRRRLELKTLETTAPAQRTIPLPVYQTRTVPLPAYPHAKLGPALGATDAGQEPQDSRCTPRQVKAGWPLP